MHETIVYPINILSLRTNHEKYKPRAKKKLKFVSNIDLHIS